MAPSCEASLRSLATCRKNVKVLRFLFSKHGKLSGNNVKNIICYMFQNDEKPLHKKNPRRFVQFVVKNIFPSGPFH